MAWVRLSDDFYDHPKFDRVGSLGIALFTASLAWCNRNLSDGFIPRRTAARLLDFEDAVEAVRNADRNAVTNGSSNDDLTPAIARIVIRRLVEARLWHEVEGGYRVHDYLDYQGSKEQIEAGRKSNAARQRAWRDRQKAEKRNGTRNGVTNGPVTGAPNPNPTEEVLLTSSSSASPRDGDPVREDVERICEHLADRIEQNDSKRPTISKRWRDAVRLMIDADGRTEEQVHKAIDWCQDSEFWRSNVLSMHKLREKYDTLRLQAQRDGTKAAPGHQPYRDPTDSSGYYGEL
ncbi:hypothetical protein [Sphaerisporangium album]|uniref:hypothetical protein n=1 Tax=Sphaerisporangium album TaxID=509200 RepID=UPI001C690DD6|nr:hypothetical protein [Sphaerisporangium album]